MYGEVHEQHVSNLGSRRDQKAYSMPTSATASTLTPVPYLNGLHRATAVLAGLSREDTGTQTLMRLEGSFDALSAPAARTALDALVSEHRSPVAIDMSALQSIDSSGIGAVVSVYKRVLAQGGRLSVQGLKGQPLALFQMLRLDRLMTC